MGGICNNCIYVMHGLYLHSTHNVDSDRGPKQSQTSGDYRK